MANNNSNKILVPSGFPGINLHLGDHICHIYDGHIHLLTKLVPFFKAGLENNEKCISFLTPETEELFRKFSGKQSEKFSAIGALKLIKPKEIVDLYSAKSLREFGDFLTEKAFEAIRQGFKNLRFVGQIEAIIQEVGYERMVSIEEVSQEIIPKLPMVAICEYPLDLNVLENTMMKIWSSHSYRLSGTELIKEKRNFYVINNDE